MFRSKSKQKLHHLAAPIYCFLFRERAESLFGWESGGGGEQGREAAACEKGGVNRGLGAKWAREDFQIFQKKKQQ